MAAVSQSLDTTQQAALTALVDSLGYLPPTGAFLYSQPIPMPEIMNTDFLFSTSSSDVGDGGRGSTRPGTGPSLRALPNPATGSIAMHLVLPTAGTVRLSIHDANGRAVRVVADGVLAAGAHQLSWGGSDAAGRLVPTGVYFARLDTAGGTRSLKLFIVR